LECVQRLAEQFAGTYKEVEVQGVAVSLPSVAVSQSPVEKFREYLASRPEPKRFTDQMRDLVDHVFAKHSHFDTDQLIEELKTAGKPVSRATVYRTLSKLVDAGMLRTIEIGPRTVFDHDYGYPWHEHFVCDTCHTIIEFQNDGIEELLRGIAAEHRFRMTSTTLMIRGECRDCSEKSAAKRRYVM
jgi:Fur family ferric uptake transcriptional regulator